MEILLVYTLVLSVYKMRVEKVISVDIPSGISGETGQVCMWQ